MSNILHRVANTKINLCPHWNICSCFWPLCYEGKSDSWDLSHISTPGFTALQHFFCRLLLKIALRFRSQIPRKGEMVACDRTMVFMAAVLTRCFIVAAKWASRRWVWANGVNPIHLFWSPFQHITDVFSSKLYFQPNIPQVMPLFGGRFSIRKIIWILLSLHWWPVVILIYVQKW